MIRSSLRMIAIKKRARLLETRPSVKVKSSGSELETNSPLYLALREQCAAGSVDSLKRCVEDE